MSTSVAVTSPWWSASTRCPMSRSHISSPRRAVSSNGRVGAVDLDDCVGAGVSASLMRPPSVHAFALSILPLCANVRRRKGRTHRGGRLNRKESSEKRLDPLRTVVKTGLLWKDSRYHGVPTPIHHQSHPVRPPMRTVLFRVDWKTENSVSNQTKVRGHIWFRAGLLCTRREWHSNTSMPSVPAGPETGTTLAQRQLRTYSHSHDASSLMDQVIRDSGLSLRPLCGSSISLHIDARN